MTEHHVITQKTITLGNLCAKFAKQFNTHMWMCILLCANMMYKYLVNMWTIYLINILLNQINDLSQALLYLQQMYAFNTAQCDLYVWLLYLTFGTIILDVMLDKMFHMNRVSASILPCMLWCLTSPYQVYAYASFMYQCDEEDKMCIHNLNHVMVVYIINTIVNMIVNVGISAILIAVCLGFVLRGLCYINDLPLIQSFYKMIIYYFTYVMQMVYSAYTWCAEIEIPYDELQRVEENTAAAEDTIGLITKPLHTNQMRLT